MCKASDDFYDAHGYPSDKHEHKDKPSGMGKPNNQNKNGSGLTNSGPPAKTCINCGLNNHDTSECRIKGVAIAEDTLLQRAGKWHFNKCFTGHRVHNLCHKIVTGEAGPDDRCTRTMHAN